MKNRKPAILILAALAGALGGVIATLPKVLPVLRPLLDPAVKQHLPFYAACGAAWALLSLYWEKAAKSVAPEAAESQASRRIHVAAVNVALLLEFLPIRGLGRFVPVSLPIMWVGIAMLLAGLALALWSRRCLGRNWSDIIAVNRDQQLIRSGPYRWVRHPIYSGLLAMYGGTSLVRGEWIPLTGFVLAALAYFRKIRLEEAALSNAFGAEYETYRRSRAAIVPGLF